MTIESGISLDTIKAFLGYPGGSPSDTSRDVLLQLWLDASIDAIKTYTGRSLELAVYRDTFGYLPEHTYLREYPIIETLEVSIGGSVLNPDTDYKVFADSGRLQFPHRHRFFDNRGFGIGGSHNRLVIDYYGGYTVLPPVMQMAVLVGIQAADAANRQMAVQGGMVKQMTVIDVGAVTYLTRANYTSAALQQAINEHLAEYLGATGAIYAIGAPALNETERLADMPGSPYP